MKYFELIAEVASEVIHITLNSYTFWLSFFVYLSNYCVYQLIEIHNEILFIYIYVIFVSQLNSNYVRWEIKSYYVDYGLEHRKFDINQLMKKIIYVYLVNKNKKTLLFGEGFYYYIYMYTYVIVYKRKRIEKKYIFYYFWIV